MITALIILAGVVIGLGLAWYAFTAWIKSRV